MKRRAARLVDQVADGVLSGAAVNKRLDALEVRRTDLQAELAAVPAESGLVMHPAVPDPLERQAAREAFRALIRKMVVTSLSERGRSEVTVVTELAALVSEGGPARMTTLGAGTGFERKPTPRRAFNA